MPSVPELQITENGKKVTTPEIVEDMKREEYGRLPKNIPNVPWTVKITDREFVGRAPVIAKQLTGHVDNNSYPLINVDIVSNRKRCTC